MDRKTSHYTLKLGMIPIVIRIGSFPVAQHSNIGCALTRYVEAPVRKHPL